ncbi:PREDICTED: IQ and AAA domain-containing protein 1-like [Gavialis gangeticus]|uniref:IQ and AAA domain-containing protein 1-like n=1 Tax=Gavialis gangeticus TaxID=94835 RepID=UPI00092FAC91|nr:PREDICTED: IQ and AAA domain-containing protein 1-like [Gavialis gangeticus]
MWLESQVALKELLAQELPAAPPQPERDRAAFSHGLATLFLRYVQVVRCLETCHDQMLQPQKRRMLRRVLDGALGRVLELKEALVQLDRSEYHFMDHALQDLKLTPARERSARDGGTKELDRKKAAIRIQKVWKGCLQRRRTALERQQEMAFIGMVSDPAAPGLSAVALRAQLGEDFRRLRQADREAEYQQALASTRALLLDLEGPSLQEAMKEQLRQWFLECRDLTGHFPEYPDEDVGGSSILFAEKTPEQVREELEQLEREEGEKKKKKKEKEKEKKGKKKKDKKPEEAASLMLPPSSFLPVINTGFMQYQATWGEWDTGESVQQGCNLELIKAQMRKEVEKEVRLQQKLGKKRGKKEKDLTQDRTLDSLYEELALQGILRKPQPVPLADYTGDFSYLGSTLRAAGAEPAPSVLDVRQNVVLYAILRLGSPTVHELAPQVRSLLLAGPAGTGKKMLVHAVCTETGANLFDLSPENLVDKYPGKAGLSLLMHMVFKVARLLQPSVIWVGNAEKTFYKKVPKEEKEAEPKRLRKELPKALKTLRVDDRVLLLGTSDRPYAADAKALCKAYERVLLVPRPDYASRYVTWQRLIQKHSGTVGHGLDLSALATVSDGYSQGSVAQVVRTVLTERRILQLPRRPLRAEEFLQLLPKADPIYSEEEKLLQDWYLKTPLGKRWLKAMEEQVEGKEMQAKKKGRK